MQPLRQTSAGNKDSKEDDNYDRYRKNLEEILNKAKNMISQYITI
jgi:hypothetical protein